MTSLLDKALLMAVGANAALLFVVMNHGNLHLAQQVVLVVLISLAVVYAALGIARSVSKKRAHG